MVSPMSAMVKFPHFSTIGAATLAVPIRYGLAHRIPTDEIEELVGFPIDPILSGKGRYASHLGPVLMNRVAQDFGDRCPTLDLGNLSPFSLFNGIERLVALSRSGKHALELFERYFASFHNGMSIDLERSGSFVRMSFGFDQLEPDGGSCNEIALMVFARLMRSVLGEFGLPTEVFLGYDTKGYVAEYENAYVARVNTNDTDRRFGFVFRHSDMETLNPSHDHNLLEHAERGARRRLEAISREEPSEQLIRLQLAAEVCVKNQNFKIEDIASTAGMTVRTAQRVARSSDTSLQRTMDDARLARVRDAVRDEPRISAEGLATIAGYSDERSLRRALQRWNSMTLRELRATTGSLQTS
ncbi:MAG: AraC family transcriptional regulator ligand-binding domain-containing protein [Pseudomonadota bacterium]